MESETIMMIEILFVMFIPSILINTLSWIMINRHIKKRDRQLREYLVELLMIHETSIQEKRAQEVVEIVKREYSGE